MRSREFPTCCGINLLTEFGNTSTAINDTNYTVEQVDAFLKKHNTPYNKALNMIVLNNEQREKLKKVLYDNGYRLTRLKGYYHPAHQTEIFIYIRENFPNGKEESKTLVFDDYDEEL